MQTTIQTRNYGLCLKYIHVAFVFYILFCQSLLIDTLVPFRNPLKEETMKSIRAYNLSGV